MKFIQKDAKPGDIIRIPIGPIFHYGIYVNDDEVIQFGLPPINSIKRKDQDIQVLTTNIETFACGQFIEVGELTLKEKLLARKPTEVIENARNCLGEKGYNILHNNCEHFVNRCVFGKSKSSMVDSFKEIWRNFPLADVYVATYPFPCLSEEIQPAERAGEIDSCSNSRVKMQKFYVWKLLEYGLERSVGKKISELNFTKAPEGFWKCDNFEISLSHCDSAVAVAISRTPIGIDIENVSRDFHHKIAGKILSSKEAELFSHIEEKEKNLQLLKLWTQKEALFKQSKKKSFSPGKIDTTDSIVETTTVDLKDEKLILSVATETPDKIRIYYPFNNSL